MRTILRDAMRSHAYVRLPLAEKQADSKLRLDYGSGFWGTLVLKGSYEGFKKRIYNFRSFLKNQRKRMTRAFLNARHVST